MKLHSQISQVSPLSSVQIRFPIAFLGQGKRQNIPLACICGEFMYIHRDHIITVLNSDSVLVHFKYIFMCNSFICVFTLKGLVFSLCIYCNSKSRVVT